MHKCERCGGSGLVCPACRGDRVVRERPWSTQHDHVSVVRCDKCWTGQVNRAYERQTIMRYLTKWLREQQSPPPQQEEGDA